MENSGLLWLFLWLPVILTNAKDGLTEILYQLASKARMNSNKYFLRAGVAGTSQTVDSLLEPKGQVKYSTAGHEINRDDHIDGEQQGSTGVIHGNCKATWPNSLTAMNASWKVSLKSSDPK
jgi:hypothetical protein